MNMDIFDTMLLPKQAIGIVTEHVGQRKTQHCSTVRHSNHFEPQLQTRDNLLAKSPPLLKQQISRKLRQCGCFLGAPPSSKMPGGAWDSMKRYGKHGKATNRSKRIGRNHKKKWYQHGIYMNILEYTYSVLPMIFLGFVNANQFGSTEGFGITCDMNHGKTRGLSWCWKRQRLTFQSFSVPAAHGARRTWPVAPAKP